LFDADSAATLLLLQVEPEQKAYCRKVCGAMNKDAAEAEQVCAALLRIVLNTI